MEEITQFKQLYRPKQGYSIILSNTNLAAYIFKIIEIKNKKGEADVTETYIKRIKENTMKEFISSMRDYITDKV